FFNLMFLGLLRIMVVLMPVGGVDEFAHLLFFLKMRVQLVLGFIVNRYGILIGGELFRGLIGELPGDFSVSAILLVQNTPLGYVA
ncbi:hypothetical protein, partial [Enterobacter hormaechei]